MPSLYELTQELNVGDKIVWVGENNIGETERTSPRTVTDIDEDSAGKIEVTAEGPEDGKYSYEVTEDGWSKSIYQGPDGERRDKEGKVAFAELVDSEETVLIKRGYHDSRKGRWRE